MTANADARAAHEHGLAEFLVPERRDRFRESLADPRRRAKLLGEFAHYEHRLDPRFATPHPPTTKHAAHVQQVLDALVEAGAPPTCVTVADTELDGREAPLAAAVADLMFTGSGFVSCVPRRLALYVGEDGPSVYVLRR